MNEKALAIAQKIGNKVGPLDSEVIVCSVVRVSD